MKFWPHRHTYDPAKWKEISNCAVSRQNVVAGVPIGDPVPIGPEIVYSNTCITCGDLAFRRVKGIE